MGVKFGKDEGTEGPLLHAKFHSHRCNDRGAGPQKLKFLLRFDRNVEYKRPAGAYPLRDFYKICRVCTSFQDALGVKIWLDLLVGLWSYGGFKLRVSGSPYSQCPLAAKLCVRPQKFSRGKNVLEVLYHHAKFGGGSDFTRRRGSQKRWVFLFVCLFVTLLNVRDCAPAMKALEYRNDFDTVG